MSTAQPPSTMPLHPDRSTRLLLLGVFQIALGCLSWLMAMFMAVVPFLAPPPQAQPGQAMNAQAMIPAMVIYLLLAVAFIWIGIGLARARRWAWTLTVVFSWIWLIMGLAAMAAFVFFGGPMMRAAMPPGNMPPEAIMVMQLVTGAFVACAYVLLPGIFLVFCQPESVRATCQRRDPNVPWTDRCPMPVLALSIMHALGFASMFWMVVYGPVMPLFGVFLSGAAGVVVIVLIALLLAYLAWGTYRLQMAAWWGAVLLGIVGAVNMVVTFTRADLMAMYEKMRMPPEQLEMIRKMGLAEWMSAWAPWMGTVGGVAWIGYLVFVRRYFVQSAKEAKAASPEV